MFNQQLSSNFHSMHSLAPVVPQHQQHQFQQQHNQHQQPQHQQLVHQQRLQQQQQRANLWQQQPPPPSQLPLQRSTSKLELFSAGDNNNHHHHLYNRLQSVAPIKATTDNTNFHIKPHQNNQIQSQKLLLMPQQQQQQQANQQRVPLLSNWQFTNGNGSTNGNSHTASLTNTNNINSNGNGFTLTTPSSNGHNHNLNHNNNNLAPSRGHSPSGPMSFAVDGLLSLQSNQRQTESVKAPAKTMNYISDFDLMREVVFALQGLPGKVIRPDLNGRFIVTQDYCIEPTQRMLLEKLTGFGWLVNKIKSYINSVNKDKIQGKVSQCLAASLKSELLDYYSMVTTIEQLSKTPNSSDLIRTHVMSLDYYFKFKHLAMLVDACQGKHGGQIVYVVFKFTQQGDIQIKEMFTRILSQVMVPIRQMLSQWIFHGEFQDPYYEFFICQTPRQSTMSLFATTDSRTNNDSMSSINHSQSDHQLYSILYKQQQQLNRVHQYNNHKHQQASISHEFDYTLQTKMMPGFVTKHQANKILATGKAVRLLRKVCADSGISLPIYEHLERSFESTICGEEIAFENLLEKAHKEFSQKALELLVDNFKLKKHFRALRQYLLLGHGDFYRHLIDLLEEELEKPAKDCRFQNIFSILETAILSTNAQYEDTDIITRLDCSLLDIKSKNVCGWDIFTLVYKIDEPISSVFTEERMSDYAEIFKQLWRAKRVEHTLATLWTGQMFYSKKVHENQTVSHILHKSNILLSKIIHFMQNFQDFVMFQVIEYCWTDLEAASANARDIDEMIAAHNLYLKKIKLGLLCQKDNKSEALNAQLSEQFQYALELKELLNSLWLEIDSKIDKKLIVKENVLNKLSEELHNKRHLMSSITNFWAQSSQIKLQY